MIGKTISHYNILEVLGEGGMGVVYKARDLNLDRLVAIKFLPQTLTMDDQSIQQFLHGARAASTLDHPNICPVYEFDKTVDGKMFLVMAYCSGQTLQQVIDDTGAAALPLDKAINIAIQISRGLAKAHKKDIIHRDIKPANIIIDEDGSVKILDFGLAAMKKDISKAGKLSTAGTVEYMSPEQTMGESVDQRTDIWSLGVVMYQMLGGSLPFDGERDQAIIYSILKEDPEPISTKNKEVPKKLEQIVSKTIAKDPDNRYHNADEILIDIRNFKDLNDQNTSQKSKVSTSTYLASSIAIFILFILFSLNMFIPQSERQDQKNVIAVLPFKNLSTDIENEYFSEGITEDIRAQLSKIIDFRVMSRMSVTQYKDKSTNLAEIADKLNAGFALEGSVRRHENRVRIVVQLFETLTGERLWTETYDREMTDIFDIQSDIARKIAVALKNELTPKENNRLQKRPTTNLTAYDLYLKGHKYSGRKYALGGYAHAVKFYKKAIELDSDFALAYSGLANVYVSRGANTRRFPRAWLDSALVEAKKAVALDPNNSAIYNALGRVYHGKGWRQKALDAYLKAINLNPSNDMAMNRVAKLKRDVGEYDEALSWSKRALKINPTIAQTYGAIGSSYFFLKKYDKAIEWYYKKLDIEPDAYLRPLATVYLAKGEFDQAAILFNHADTNSEYSYADQGLIYQTYGRPDMSIPLLKKALQINPRNAWHYMGLAGIYVEQNQLDKAITLYQKGLKLVPDFLRMSLTYSFLLSLSGRTEEAREVLEKFNRKLPWDYWLKPIALFYLGEINEPQMEDLLKDAYIDVRGVGELPPETSYFLAMAYLHKLDKNTVGSQGYTDRAIELLQKCLIRTAKDGVENAVIRAELRRLGVLI